jgi:hypothetical protein
MSGLCVVRYSPFEHEEKRQLESEVFRQIVKRDGNATNFIEVHTERRARLPMTLVQPLTGCLCVGVHSHSFVSVRIRIRIRIRLRIRWCVCSSALTN